MTQITKKWVFWSKWKQERAGYGIWPSWLLGSLYCVIAWTWINPKLNNGRILFRDCSSLHFSPDDPKAKASQGSYLKPYLLSPYLPLLFIFSYNGVRNIFEYPMPHPSPSQNRKERQIACDRYSWKRLQLAWYRRIWDRSLQVNDLWFRGRMWIRLNTMHSWWWTRSDWGQTTGQRHFRYAGHAVWTELT